jgi:hypothetical protein
MNIATTFKRTMAAAAAASAITSIVAAPPAAAATQFTQSHFTIDNDSVVVGRNPNNQFKAFNANLEYFHSGSHIRGELVGHFVGTGDLRLVFTFNTGATFTQTISNGGVDKSIDIVTDQSRDFVKLRATFTPSNAAQLTNLDQTVVVGDSDSDGTCNQLDADGISLSNNQASFAGRVKWSCTTDGHVVAQVTGDVTRKSGATKDSYIGGHIEYSDGSTSVFLSRVVTSGSPTQSLVTVNSNATKQARRVDVSLYGDSSSEPMKIVKLGDA